MLTRTAATESSGGLASADVVGFGFGGMVAQELCIQFPKVAKSLSLVGTATGGKGGSIGGGNGVCASGGGVGVRVKSRIFFGGGSTRSTASCPGKSAQTFNHKCSLPDLKDP